MKKLHHHIISKYFLSLLLVLFATQISSGQSKMKAYLEKHKEKKKEAIAVGKPWLSPLFGPGYTADIGFLVAGGFLLSFKTDKSDSLIQRSSIPANIFYSSSGALGLHSNITTFWFQDKMRINSDVNINKRPLDYYGKGYQEIDSNYKSDSTTQYTESKVDVAVDVMFKLTKNFYIGPSFDFFYANNTDVNPVMLDDPYYNQFSSQYFMNGLGINITYDSRDITVNAWQGIYFNLKYINYAKALGSDYQAHVTSLDLRYYRTFIRKGNVIAGRVYSRNAQGDVPINMLSDIAGSKRLRGYIVGQYRDNTSAFFEVEWRHTFMKRNGELTKSGIVMWVGAGSIAPNMKSLTQWMQNYGIGYRYELQPRMNVGIDMGFGQSSHGLYFSFTESF
ncbi:BamA/TamA family outer membrane protein [Flammeovirga sp. SubArs3]|uniref:BamA/TamA family outer membrane protein n=1 Tax=Flammeovirga sp. SubArs3 TaxID=2995316 RepID=UPI00248A9DAB|nr:BamA/TamA family outer membrane protein [Flammeovirga sp. SubArs3]